MSHKLEDLQAKTNRLTEEAAKMRIPSGECREDRGDEDIQPTPPPSPPATTTTTTSSNHHQQEKLKATSLSHLLWKASTVSTTGAQAQMTMSKPVTIGNTPTQALINLKPVCRSTALH
ncbi:unnamed protein product [Heterobilharzia americana]|nr:unnamed protein product [Heterobilharzia americana]